MFLPKTYHAHGSNRYTNIMVIGIPRERKKEEFRVSLTPDGVRELVNEGHEVFVEHNAGAGIGVTDTSYLESGAKILESEKELFHRSELIVKVKEPQPEEYDLLSAKHILFCYLHLAAQDELVQALIKSGVTAIAFETVQLDDGTLPLLAPMSRVAGMLSVQIGAHLLEKPQGGKGIIPGGLPGVRSARILIIGGGTVGLNAATIAYNLGAEVIIIEKNSTRLSRLYDYFNARVTTLPSHRDIIERECKQSDIVIGAVLVPGLRAPKVVTKEIVRSMETGSVIVDVAIDQGGCVETSQPTTLDNPAYTVDGIIHYCATNIPSLVARSASYYLSNEILPYVKKIAAGELDYQPIKKGINVKSGKLVIQF